MSKLFTYQLKYYFSIGLIFLAMARLGHISSAFAQENALSLTDVETIPGTSITMFLQAQLSQPIRRFQVGFSYPRRAMELTEVSFKDTPLEGVHLDLFNPVFTTNGFSTLEVSLDEMSPFRNDIPAGSNVVLARLHFEMKQGLNPGEEFSVNLESDLGFPPVPALIFSGDTEITPDLNSSIVKIIDQNVLKIENLKNVKAGEISTLEFIGFNLDPLQGFTISMTFDPEKVHVLSGHIRDTITEAVGAEFIDPVIDNENGSFILGVLLDIGPPFETQMIPAGGTAFSIAKADLLVTPEVNPDSLEEVIPLTLVDGLGSPPKKNIFVIDNESILPRKEDGSITVIRDVPFLRGDAFKDGKINITDPIRIINFALLQIQGVPCQKAADANDDGRVDLADVLTILFYLFRGTEIIAAPFPEVGFDPTPDLLSCERPDEQN